MKCAVIWLTFLSLISLCSSQFIPQVSTPIWHGATGFCLAIYIGRQVQLDDCNHYVYTVEETHVFKWTFIHNADRFKIVSSVGALCLQPPIMNRVLEPLIVGDCTDVGFNRWIMKDNLIMLATEPYILTFKSLPPDANGIVRMVATLKHVGNAGVLSNENVGDGWVPQLSFLWYFSSPAIWLRPRLTPDFHLGDCLETIGGGYARGSPLQVISCDGSELWARDGRNLWIPLEDGRYLSSVSVPQNTWQCIDIGRGLTYDCLHESLGQLVQMDDGALRSALNADKCLAWGADNKIVSNPSCNDPGNPMVWDISSADYQRRASDGDCMAECWEPPVLSDSTFTKHIYNVNLTTPQSPQLGWQIVQTLPGSGSPIRVNYQPVNPADPSSGYALDTGIEK